MQTLSCISPQDLSGKKGSRGKREREKDKRIYAGYPVSAVIVKRPPRQSSLDAQDSTESHLGLTCQGLAGLVVTSAVHPSLEAKFTHSPSLDQLPGPRHIYKRRQGFSEVKR